MGEVINIEQKKATPREAIISFENSLVDNDNVQLGDSVLCPLTHLFSDGMYVRQISIPAGTLLTGKIHKHQHPNFLMQGEVEVFTESDGFQVLKAPLSMISEPGTKRAIKTITDTIWVTVHNNPTNTQDLLELEDLVIAKSFEEYDAFIANKIDINNPLNKLQ